MHRPPLPSPPVAANAPPIWHPAPAFPSLEPGALHLWRIHTDQRGLNLRLAASRLGEHQRTRAARMRHPSQRERYIRAQGALAGILASYLGCAPESLRLEHGPTGKPYLAGAHGWLAFNLSHSGDLALLGLSRDDELGVDCERIQPRGDLLAIARRMFAPEVVERLERFDAAARLEPFHHAWTALEADAKRDGRGLFRSRPAGATPAAIAHLAPAPGYIAAVARGALPPLSAWHFYEPQAG